MLKHLMSGSSLSSFALFAPASDKGFNSEQKEMIAGIREAFKDHAEHDLRLSDRVIIDVASKCENWEEMEDEEKMKLFSDAEATMDTLSVADPAITALVAKIDGDDQAQAEIGACIDATMKNKSSAVDVYAQFKRVYSKADLDAMPIPGSDKDTVTGNAKPDIVKTNDVTGKALTKVWSNDFVSSMRWGKSFEQVISDVKKEQKAPGSVPSLKDISTNKKLLAAKLSEATARRNALRSMVKRAISLHHKFEAINAMPQVQIEWIKGAGGEKATIMPNKFGESKGHPVTGAPKPIWIFPRDSASDGRDFSVTQVLAFDPAKALNMPQGGTMAELVATAATGPATPEGETEKTLDDFTSDVVDYAKVLNNRENMATLLKKVAPSKDETDTEADDLLDSVCSLYLLLKPIYDKNKSRYEKLQMREDQADERKTA